MGGGKQVAGVLTPAERKQIVFGCGARVAGNRVALGLGAPQPTTVAHVAGTVVADQNLEERKLEIQRRHRVAAFVDCDTRQALGVGQRQVCGDDAGEHFIAPLGTPTSANPQGGEAEAVASPPHRWSAAATRRRL